jgi:Glycosyl hydrolase family 26
MPHIAGYQPGRSPAFPAAILRRVAAPARRLLVAATLTALIGVGVLVLTHALTPSRLPAVAGTQSTYWGAEIGPQFTGSGAPWDMNALTDFKDAVDKAPSIVAFNLPFEECDRGPCTYGDFPSAQMTSLRSFGAIPFLNWSSQSSPLSGDQPGFRLAGVARGRFDSYIRAFAVAVKAWGHPFFLRFDWEMNRSWFPWGSLANGNREGDFVNAWRHVHSIFTAVGARNATWVWCPYADPQPQLPNLERLYPGDSYVDWTCLDGYNFGTSEGKSASWQNFSTLFGPSYRAITRGVAPTKPMIIGEVASSEQGGSKPLWIRDMLSEIPAQFPKIRGFVWFDTENTQAGTRDSTLPLESSRASLSSFASSIASQTYTANQFGGLSGSPIPAPSG